MPQLSLLGLTELGEAQFGAQPGYLALQRRDLLLLGRRAGHVVEQARHGAGYRAHQAFGRSEDCAADPAQAADRAAAGGPAARVDGDQCQGSGQQHGQNQAGPPTVVHRASSSTPPRRLAA